MKTYPFEYSEELPLLVVTASLDGYEVRLALDTGASHNLIDLTCLLLAGYGMEESIGTEVYETAGGVVSAQTFRIGEFEVFGIRIQEFEVSSYDFLGTGVLSDIDGLLGLDFFEGRHFCIDMVSKTIRIES